MKGIEEKQIEAPYELPEGWKWCRLGDFINIFRGVSYKKNDAHNEKQENDCLIIRGGNIDEGCINLNSDNVFVNKSLVSENQIIKKNDVIIVTSTGSIKVIGRAGVSASDYEDVAFGAFLTLARPNEKANKSFVNQYFQSSLYRERIRQLASGVNINNIRIEYITESPFPLPPTLDEQQRIVNRIESMFVKLDEAKEKAQNVVDGFETRKAAILHKAFTGELTAKWRKENGVCDDSWEEKTVGDCCVEVKVGIVIKPTRYYTEAEKGIPAFRSANVRENHIDDFDWVYINDEGMKNEQRSIVHTNDVLVVRSGAPGTACVVTDQFDGYNAIDILIAVPTQDIINSYFLCYYTNSPMGKNIVAEKKRGLGLTHFNVKGYSATPIKVPTLPEQQEIVRILETVLEKESRAKEASQTVLDQIALLKKSILARAFRGEL